jgi:hypothetical protein
MIATAYPEALCSWRLSLPSSLLRPHVPIPLPLLTFAFTLGQQSLPLGPPTAGQGTFPTLHSRIFHWMLCPLPQRLQRCSYPFLPFGLRLSRSLHPVSANMVRTATSVRGKLWGCRHFFMLRPPVLLATQVAPTAAVSPQGSRGVNIQAEYGSLPSHTLDLLVVRFGQLTTGDFHPIRLAACRLLRKPPFPTCSFVLLCI